MSNKNIYADTVITLEAETVTKTDTVSNTEMVTETETVMNMATDTSMSFCGHDDGNGYKTKVGDGNGVGHSDGSDERYGNTNGHNFVGGSVTETVPDTNTKKGTDW